MISSCKCKICNFVYSDSENPCPNCGGNYRDILIKITDKIKIRDNIDIKKFIKGVKKFLLHTKSGWFSSGNKEKYPEGVNLNQTVDRENKLYIKQVQDIKTGKIIKDLREPLNNHK